VGRKRGQITVYLIIGLIALISVSVFLYTRSVKYEAPISFKPTIDQIPTEAQPIRDFVSTCLRTVAEDGLVVIGDRGGYLDLEHMQTNYNPVMATEGGAVVFSPGSDLLVPYWWHMDSPNSCADTKGGGCSFKTNWPNLYRAQGGTNIEEQLDEYVNENLEECLVDFVDFSEFGFTVTPTGDVDTKTVVTQETVAFQVNYPITAQKAGVTYTVNEYFVEVPLKLKEMYEIAHSLVALQAEHAYLDYYVKSLVSLFAGVDENAFPPFRATGIDSSGGKIWMKSDVREKVVQLLTAYIPFIRVSGTSNYRFIDIPEGASNRDGKAVLYNSMNLVPLINQSHPGMEVHYSYLDWNERGRMYFNIGPCDGEICRSQDVSGTGVAFSFFLQQYAFNYDISMPVLVTVSSPDDFNGKGYTFKYFIETNMRNNKPVIEGVTLSTPAVNFVSGTMVCDENKRTSPEATLELVDARTGLFVPDADVLFRCGTEQCNMGTTDSNGKLTSKYPVCAGGSLDISKEEYVGASLIFNTNFNYPFEDRVLIQPFRYKDIEIRKIELTKNCIPNFALDPNTGEETGDPISHDCTWIIDNETLPFGDQEKGEELTDLEEAVIMLERVESSDGKPFFVAGDYVGDRDIEDHSRDVQVLPGKYAIDISMLNREEFSIPSSQYCYDPGIFQDDDCTSIDAVDFDYGSPFFSGGAATNVTIRAEDLDKNDIIVFYVFTAELDDVPEDLREHEDVEQISDILEVYSIIYADLLQPDFKEKEVDSGSGRGGTFII